MKIVNIIFFPHDIQKARKHLNRIKEYKINLEVAHLIDKIARILDRGKLRTIDRPDRKPLRIDFIPPPKGGQNGMDTK